MRIVIVIDGGLVQDVISSEPVEVAVVDYDVEGVDLEDLTAIPQGEGCTDEPAYVFELKEEINPERVLELFDAIQEQNECAR